MKGTLPERDQASAERSHFVKQLSPGAHIHISGICGTGTAAVAGLLKQLGYRVSGSDKAFYPPMGDVVRKIANELFTGYSAENLEPAPDLVVIGNSLSSGNEEVEHVFGHGLPYASMPEVFEALLIGERKDCGNSVVVAGTHGKTSTSAMIATLLEESGRKPGFFIGGLPKNLPATIRPVDSERPAAERVVVLEGDEYDSAFFAKWPKFHSYRPDIAVVTSLEFDHADIYESLEQIQTEFRRLAERVPQGGTVLLCDDYRSLDDLGSELRGISADVIFYGEREGSPFRLLERRCSADGQELRVDLRGRELSLRTSQSGRYNAFNILATAAVGSLLGLSDREIQEGVRSYVGVARRQEVRFAADDILVLEDFAHHPTAVAQTLGGVRESYPDKRIVAVFEPRSNTSRRAIFQEQYTAAFAAADLSAILQVQAPGGYSNTSVSDEPLSVSAIVDSIVSSGKQAEIFADVAELEGFLLETLTAGDVCVVMSNGDFGGLIDKLVSGLSARSS